MAMQLKEIIEKNNLIIVADMGYDNAMEIKKCYDDNITPIVPLSNKHQKQKDTGKFTRYKFVYNKSDDNYICLNNQILSKRKVAQIRDNGKVNFIYSRASAICKACPLRYQCLPSKTPYKSIFRCEHAEIMEEHSIKMKTEESKDMIKKRGSIVEHPFGTIKIILGWNHFIVRGKEKVLGENSLIIFTYNFKKIVKFDRDCSI